MMVGPLLGALIAPVFFGSSFACLANDVVPCPKNFDECDSSSHSNCCLPGKKGNKPKYILSDGDKIVQGKWICRPDPPHYAFGMLAGEGTVHLLRPTDETGEMCQVLWTAGSDGYNVTAVPPRGDKLELVRNGRLVLSDQDDNEQWAAAGCGSGSKAKLKLLRVREDKGDDEKVIHLSTKKQKKSGRMLGGEKNESKKKKSKTKTEKNKKKSKSAQKGKKVGSWWISKVGVETDTCRDFACSTSAGESQDPTYVTLPDLYATGSISRDTDGIAHICAVNEHDMFLLQGYVHAQDRLFQMDEFRRIASGTLAELLGQEALESDVELRTFGLLRAAEVTWTSIQEKAQSGDEISLGTANAIKAYVLGVNAAVDAADQLPPEYGALGISAFAPWTEIDSVAVGKLLSFQLSFDLDDISNTVILSTYEKVEQATGGAFDATKLFFEDLFRSQPFNDAAIVPDSGGDGSEHPGYSRRVAERGEDTSIPLFDATVAEMGRNYLEKARKVPLLKKIVEQGSTVHGSNAWGVMAHLSETGHPLIANDPHLDIFTPTTFYPVHLSSPEFDFAGNSFAGTSSIITGQNRCYAWGLTNHRMDVTDVFSENLVVDGNSPFGLSIELPNNELGKIVPIQEDYFSNNFAGGLKKVQSGTTLTVPARYNGPIIEFNQTTMTALTVQYTGFGATFELEAVYAWSKGCTKDEFLAGLELFDVGSQNLVYADRNNNVAMFTSGEMPIRTDLETDQRPALDRPPYFIRIGNNPGHQWLAKINNYPSQVLPYEILAPHEMPQVVNPQNGYVVCANHDPVGFTLDNNPLNQFRESGGIFYFSSGYRFRSGFRAGRIKTRLQRYLDAGNGKLSVEKMSSIQADVGLLDASFFVPHVLAAYGAGLEQGADSILKDATSGLAEAIGFLQYWIQLDYQAKSGIPEGYDAEDLPNEPALSLNDDEVAASVATTIYSIWRSSFIAKTIDVTLYNTFQIPGSPIDEQALTALKTLIENQGVSKSGLNFFAGGGSANQTINLQIVMLNSLTDALNRLKSEEFNETFGQSDNLEDYRWGMLHRIVFKSRLGGPFNVPSLQNPYRTPPLSGLDGIPTDGGFETVDVAPHDARGSGSDGFMYFYGPANRWVSELKPTGPESQSAWPGGTSAVPGDPFYLNPLLERWLSNDAGPVRFDVKDIEQGLFSKTVLEPQ